METVVLRFWCTHSRAVETTVRFAVTWSERGWYPECFNGNEVLRLTLVTWLALTPIVTHAGVYMHSQTLTHSRHMHAFACILRFPYTPYTTLRSLHGIGAHAPSTSLLYSSYSTPPYIGLLAVAQACSLLPRSTLLLAAVCCCQRGFFVFVHGR